MQSVLLPSSRYFAWNLKKLLSLRSLARNLNFSITRQENLGNQLIGFAHVKQKLLLIKKKKNGLACCIINLKDLRHCAVKKVYSSICAGGLQAKSLNHYLQSVSLQLRFKNEDRAVAINFYESRFHTEKDLSFLEAAAKRWEEFLSKLLPVPAANVTV